MTLSELQELAFHNSMDKGFWEGEPGTLSIVEKLALIHSEVSEALECLRSNKGIDSWFGPGGKPEGLGTELADVVIRTADLCGALGLDLQSLVEVKMEYNKTRPRKHGKAF